MGECFGGNTGKHNWWTGTTRTKLKRNVTVTTETRPELLVLEPKHLLSSRSHCVRRNTGRTHSFSTISSGVLAPTGHDLFITLMRRLSPLPPFRTPQHPQGPPPPHHPPIVLLMMQHLHIHHVIITRVYEYATHIHRVRLLTRICVLMNPPQKPSWLAEPLLPSPFPWLPPPLWHLPSS